MLSFDGDKLRSEEGPEMQIQPTGKQQYICLYSCVVELQTKLPKAPNRSIDGNVAALTLASGFSNQILESLISQSASSRLQFPCGVSGRRLS
jgi:hypothetical protein